MVPLSCFVVALVAGPSIAQVVPSAPSRPEAHTQRILDEIAKSESRRTAQDRDAAKRLNESGDAAYRKGRYRRAFANYMNSLERHFRVGLLLASARRDVAFMASSIYTRGREIEMCLTALADKYDVQPPQTCVDPGRISSCLGEPLLAK
jgi:hypothetical protein